MIASGRKLPSLGDDRNAALGFPPPGTRRPPTARLPSLSHNGTAPDVTECIRSKTTSPQHCGCSFKAKQLLCAKLIAGENAEDQQRQHRYRIQPCARPSAVYVSFDNCPVPQRHSRCRRHRPVEHAVERKRWPVGNDGIDGSICFYVFLVILWNWTRTARSGSD